MRKFKDVDYIVAENGMLLTQAAEVSIENRIFSASVYDKDINNWVECTKEYAKQVIAQRNELEQEHNENTEDITYE